MAFGVLGLGSDFLKTSARGRMAAGWLRRGASDMRIFADWGAHVAPP